MNKLTTFTNEQFGSLRTAKINNEPWFVGKDVADALGYKNTKDALINHVSDDDKRIVQRSEIATFENNIPKEALPVNFVSADIPNRGLTFINESGLYSLIMSSKLPSAKQFKHWVTSEVLPSIRKNGAYLTDKKAYDITHDPNSLADLLLQAGEQLKQKELVIQEMKPKALFADAVSASNTSILIGDLAKLLRQNGVDIGQNRLFEWMRANGYLMTRNGSKNMPTQMAMNMKLFEVKERVINNPDGTSDLKRTTKVTGKGQQFFIKKFLS